MPDIQPTVTRLSDTFTDLLSLGETQLCLDKYGGHELLHSFHACSYQTVTIEGNDLVADVRTPRSTQDLMS